MTTKSLKKTPAPKKPEVKPQIADQAGKGVIVGIAAYLCKDNPEVMALLIPALTAGLAWLSTQLGDPDIASFLNKKR